MQVKRAIISVYDKSGVVEFARGLAELGVELISTGGTARILKDAGLAVTMVQDVTGSPELMEGRVKTLHPRIHGGILARRDEGGDMAELAAQGIQPLDMVVVNLYPFAQAVADPNCSLALALENIDIGGPTMLRAAAKNFPWVLPICRPQDYPLVLQELGQGDISMARRRQLALTAFAHTAQYDGAIAAWLGGDELPRELVLTAGKAASLRYGENPQQRAALYRFAGQEGALAWAQPLQGKELSYNNYNDAEAALALVSEFEAPAAVAVKHAVPCGVGLGRTAREAFLRAREADPVSIFGGIIALNRPVDEAAAAALAELFLEVIIAPGFSPQARAALARKKNLRLLACPNRPQQGLQVRSIAGGLLVQEADSCPDQEWQQAGAVAAPQGEWMEDALLAWLTAKHAKSNAIVVASGGMTLGIGSGCTSRIDAARIALGAAGERARGAVLASDGFIPFPDVVEEAARAGIAVILQPGGSKGDDAAIAAADEHGIAMIFTGTRHFRH